MKMKRVAVRLSMGRTPYLKMVRDAINMFLAEKARKQHKAFKRIGYDRPTAYIYLLEAE